MNPRTTGILLLVTALLGAFVYFYEIEGESDRQEAEAQEKRLFGDLDESAIRWVALTTRDGIDARLERGEPGWSLAQPLAFPADVFAADGLASNLADFSSETVLEDPQPPEEYGLGDGARVVRFGTADAEFALRIGNKTPLGSNAYAKLEGSDEILTVASFKANSFDKTLTDLRERRILDFDTDAIRRVEARWPEGSVVLERVAPDPDPDPEAEAADAEDAGEAEEGASTWALVAPLEGRADDEAVDSLLSDLSFLRADGFVDAPGDEIAKGFETPAFEVVLHGEASADGEAPTWRFAVGPLHEGDKRLVRGAHASLYTIPAERLSEMPREVVAYRFKRLAAYQISEVSQVDFFFHPREGDPVAVTAQRGPDGWSSSPEKMAPGKVARLVSELGDLQAGDILSEDATEAELAELGLAPPNTIVSVFGEAAQAPEPESEGEEAEPAPLPRLAEIHIGNVEGSEWIIARSAGDPAVYRLGYELAEHLPLSLDAFRNRFLVAEDAEAPPAAGAEPEGGGEFLTPAEESP